MTPLEMVVESVERQKCIFCGGYIEGVEHVLACLEFLLEEMAKAHPEDWPKGARLSPSVRDRAIQAYLSIRLHREIVMLNDNLVQLRDALKGLDAPEPPSWYVAQELQDAVRDGFNEALEPYRRAPGAKKIPLQHKDLLPGVDRVTYTDPTTGEKTKTTEKKKEQEEPRRIL